jgi:hypothetical protein
LGWLKRLYQEVIFINVIFFQMRIQIEQQNNYLLSDISKNHLATMYLESQVGEILDVIQYAERRYTFTMLTSKGYLNGGAALSGDLPTSIGESITVTTKIPTIQDGTIEGSEVKYKVMGRNKRAVSVIGNTLYGAATPASATSGGFFSLLLNTLEVRPTQVVEFPTGKLARVHGEPRRNISGAGFIYTFQTFAGETFVWNTWMGSGAYNKTVWASFNLVGERSRKGYMSWLMPDTYINHVSTMRKGLNLSGSALVEAGVRKYTLNIMDKGEFSGYSWTRETQMREALNEEIENWAWDGKSTMRDVYGNLLATPSMVDEKGAPIWAGDGVKEQIRGSNDIQASGVDGLPTWDDFDEMFTTARDRREQGEMAELVYVTGPKGADHLNDLYIAANKAKYGTVLQAATPANKVADIPYLRTNELYVNGETVYVVVDPRMGDKQRYGSARMANGRLSKEYEGLLLDFGVKNGKQNVAMETVSNNFVNREYVIGKFNGMTGLKGEAVTSPVDEFAMDILSERIVVVRDPKNCGLMEINPSFIL